MLVYEQTSSKLNDIFYSDFFIVFYLTFLFIFFKDQPCHCWIGLEIRLLLISICEYKQRTFLMEPLQILHFPFYGCSDFLYAVKLSKGKGETKNTEQKSIVCVHLCELISTF